MYEIIYRHRCYHLHIVHLSSIIINQYDDMFSSALLDPAYGSWEVLEEFKALDNFEAYKIFQKKMLGKKKTGGYYING